MENIKCPQCGSTNVEQVDVNRYQCPYCGTTFNGVVSQPQYATSNQFASNPDDNPGCWMNGLSFLIPIAGLVFWLVNRNSKPKSAKSYLNWAIVGFILDIICNIIMATLE